MQANLERGSINKKSYTRKNKQNLKTILFLKMFPHNLKCSMNLKYSFCQFKIFF